jgi:hypothetical protein
VKVIYETLEGTDYAWIEEAIQKKLQWVVEYDFGAEFWGRLAGDLNQLWTDHSVALINCKTPIYGFTSLVTNSAVTIYPKV